MNYSKGSQSLYNKLGQLLRLARLVNFYNKLSEVLQIGKTLLQSTMRITEQDNFNNRAGLKLQIVYNLQNGAKESQA